MLEIIPQGGNGIGVNSDIVAADDFTIQCDTNGTYAGVFTGNLSGTAGKTLTFSMNTSTTNRIRLYGANTSCDANIALTGATPTGPAAYSGTVLAPYHGSGQQVYNGVISGPGGLIQRANGLTILNARNTYTGGTTPSAGVIGLGTNSDDGLTYGPIGTGPLYVAPELGSGSGTGTILAWGGARTIANPLQYPTSGETNQVLQIGGTNALTLSGTIALQGTNSFVTNRTFQVTNTALTTFSGIISGGSLAMGLTKTGSGVLALSAAESYTGPTLVSAGTLQVDGSLAAASAVTVSSNAAIAGTGTIGGSVTVNQGGTIAPGDAAIGTLFVTGNLTNTGNLTIEVNRSGSSSDRVSVSGFLTNAGTGTITVTNLGATLQPGDSFAVFNKGISNGGAMSVTGAGVIWTNSLAVDGRIGVDVVVATTPTDLNYSISTGSLKLSWPRNYLTWYLQSNSVSPSSTNWYTVPNSSTVTNITFTINTAKTNVFYRMVRTNM